MSHTCHAMNCETAVPPKMWGCQKHWAMVPPDLQAQLWDTYRHGQERRGNPSPAYLRAAAACVQAAARAEGHSDEEIEASPDYAGYLAWAEMLDET